MQKEKFKKHFYSYFINFSEMEIFMFVSNNLLNLNHSVSKILGIAINFDHEWMGNFQMKSGTVNLVC